MILYLRSKYIYNVKWLLKITDNSHIIAYSFNMFVVCLIVFCKTVFNLIFIINAKIQMYMKKVCDLPLNSVIEYLGKKMVIYSRDDSFTYCYGYNGYFYKLKKSIFVNFLFNGNYAKSYISTH